MLLEHEGKCPRIDPSARVAANATICGDVIISALVRRHASDHEIKPKTDS